MSNASIIFGGDEHVQNGDVGLVSEGMVCIGVEDHRKGKIVSEKSTRVTRELKDFAQKVSEVLPGTTRMGSSHPFLFYVVVP